MIRPFKYPDPLSWQHLIFVGGFGLLTLMVAITGDRRPWWSKLESLILTAGLSYLDWLVCTISMKKVVYKKITSICFKKNQYNAITDGAIEKLNLGELCEEGSCLFGSIYVYGNGFR